MFTRTDYEIIASILAHAAPGKEASADVQKQHRNTVLAFALRLGHDNPRFNRAKFLAAAGVA